MEEQKNICEERQREMDACIRPRTETYEQHTISDRANRRHYTDYPTYKRTFERLRAFFWLLYRLDRVPKTFYVKFCQSKSLVGTN